MLVRNLKPYSVVAFSWNNRFNSISFKPNEVKDLTGIQIEDTAETFKQFIKDYINTNILTLIPITEIIPNSIPTNGYFDYGYILDGYFSDSA